MINTTSATKPMTDTPRTDKAAVGHIGFYSCATVPADTCRQIERDLYELWGVLNSARVGIRFGRFDDLKGLLPRIEEVLGKHYQH